jgi:hypothetical protein
MSLFYEGNLSFFDRSTQESSSIFASLSGYSFLCFTENPTIALCKGEDIEPFITINLSEPGVEFLNDKTTKTFSLQAGYSSYYFNCPSTSDLNGWSGVISKAISEFGSSPSNTNSSNQQQKKAESSSIFTNPNKKPPHSFIDESSDKDYSSSHIISVESSASKINPSRNNLRQPKGKIKTEKMAPPPPPFPPTIRTYDELGTSHRDDHFQLKQEPHRNLQRRGNEYSDMTKSSSLLCL